MTRQNWAIIGPNGSGKSALVGAIAGEVPVVNGKISRHFVEPVQGAIGYVSFGIHQRIIDLRDEGKAILLVSAELEEIRSLSDRAVVFYEGEITGEIDLENYDEREIGLMMTGELKKPVALNP